jgi:hypothetical protein
MWEVSAKSCRQNRGTKFVFIKLFWNRNVYGVINVEKYCGAREVADENMAAQTEASTREPTPTPTPTQERTHTHVFAHTHTHTHTHTHRQTYVRLIAFLRRSCFCKRTSILRYTYTACTSVWLPKNTLYVVYTVNSERTRSAHNATPLQWAHNPVRSVKRLPIASQRPTMH